MLFRAKITSQNPGTLAAGAVATASIPTAQGEIMPDVYKRQGSSAKSLPSRRRYGNSGFVRLLLRCWRQRLLARDLHCMGRRGLGESGEDS